MRVNATTNHEGIYKEKNSYFVNTVIHRYAGPRIKKNYFGTLEEAIAFKRANKDSAVLGE